MSDSTRSTERGVYFLNADRAKAWGQVLQVAREQDRTEEESRELLGRAAMLAAEQLLARKSA